MAGILSDIRSLNRLGDQNIEEPFAGGQVLHSRFYFSKKPAELTLMTQIPLFMISGGR